MRKPYRLGLDLGTNSAGWAVIDLNKRGEPVGLRALGSRLFTDGRDPKTKATLATERRDARSARRRRDRYIRRRTVLMELLVAAGLMPADRDAAKLLEREDPYDLRKRGLDEALTPHELGRALFHINQRRGFKSNRKADRDAKEDGLIASGGKALREAMESSGARTVGEYLHQRRAAGEGVRARAEGEGKDKAYPFYPQRDLMEAEFDSLWTAQAAHHPALLTDELKERLHRVIFFQRPLKPVDPGKCTFIDGEKRAPWAHPLAQRFRMLQELGNLRIVDAEMIGRGLTLAERDIILRNAFGEGKDHKPKAKVTFKQMRKLLGLSADSGFSHEDERRDHFKGDEVGAILAKPSHLGPVRWAQLGAAARAELVEQLLNAEDEEELLVWLIAAHKLDEQTALTIVRKTPLPASHIRFSVKALEKLVPVMERETVTEHGETRPIRYDEAVPLATPAFPDIRVECLFLPRDPMPGFPFGKGQDTFGRARHDPVEFGQHRGRRHRPGPFLGMRHHGPATPVLPGIAPRLGGVRGLRAIRQVFFGGHREFHRRPFERPCPYPIRPAPSRRQAPRPSNGGDMHNFGT